MQQRLSVFLIAVLMTAPSFAFAQGQDSTPGERNILIMADMLPGIYDNVNQNYFDGRRNLPEDDIHPRLHTDITRIDAPNFGAYAYLWVTTKGRMPNAEKSYRIATLSTDGADDEVILKHYIRMDGEITEDEFATLTPADLRRTEGCDYAFKRRADHFRGAQGDQTCQFEWDGEEVYTNNEIELSETGLWYVDHKYIKATGERITGVASGEPNWLERARIFHCYADVPGVAGGRDEPFERYEGFTLHDKGGIHFFETRKEPKRTLGLTLRAVTWHVNNEANDNFNRNSLVLYVLERMADGSIKDHAYTFNAAESERIGINLKWMLANCAMVPRDQAKPTL